MTKRSSLNYIKPVGRGCRKLRGFLQFTEDGRVVAEFGIANDSPSYWTIRTYWVQGKITLPDLRKEIEMICNG